MCGICGFVYSDIARQPEGELLDCMTAPLFHRGPDSKGAHVAPGVALGVRRLSIIDVEHGDQPISSEDETVIVVCNGEIYNYVELRERLAASGHRFKTRSDVEVIAHLYEDHGVDCLRFLRGMFAFALWDEREKRLLLARDRFGIKPLHYFQTPGAIYFSSEQKSFLRLPDFGGEPDPDSLDDLFHFGFISENKTMFRAVRCLPPAEYLVFSAGAVSRGRYWTLNPDGESHESPRLSAREWAEGLADKLQEAVRLHLRSDVPVGAWLSPGVDSSSVVAMMERLGAPPVQTITISFEGAPWDEARFKPTLNRYQGHEAPNLVITCPSDSLRRLPQAAWHCETPFSAGAEIARVTLADAASQFTKVVMTGEGSDEVFGGYWWYNLDPIFRPVSLLPEPFRRFLLDRRWLRRRHPGLVQSLLAPYGPLLERYRRFVAPPRGLELASSLLTPDWQQLRSRPAPAYPPDLRSGFLHFQWFDLSWRLPGATVLHLDRGSMARSVEARVPYLDHELVEFALKIPVRLRMRHFEEKHILREALKGILPEAIRKRRKRPLSPPFQHWLRRPLPDYARRLLAPPALEAKGYFTASVVQQLLEQHRSGQDSVGRLLMVILGIQLWDELFRQRRTWESLA